MEVRPTMENLVTAFPYEHARVGAVETALALILKELARSSHDPGEVIGRFEAGMRSEAEAFTALVGGAEHGLVSAAADSAAALNSLADVVIATLMRLRDEEQ